MVQKNTYRNHNSEDHFDLDNYINEKSNPEVDSAPQNFENEKKSSWFKNALLILGLVMVTLLYFNNWSPTQVYGNIFGIEKYQDGFEPAQQPPNKDIIATGSPEETALAELERLEELGEFANLENLEALEGLSNLESLEGLKELESSLNGLQNLEEMNELRTFALETAMEALTGIGESEEFGEVIGSSVQLGIQEALRELENLRETEIAGTNQLANDAINMTSFRDYSNELKQIGISEIFNSSDQQKLHQANVPSSFLNQLNELNLLERLDADSIIEAYNARD